MIRSQDPRFRLPEAVIDEETATCWDSACSSGPACGSTRSGPARAGIRRGVHRLRARPRPGPRPPRRSEAPPTSTSASTGSRRLVRPHRAHRPARDRARRRQHGDGLLRTSRRLGGEMVKVIVRSGYEEMKASPWEKEDAIHEGIPILNYLVPKAYLHDKGRLTGMKLRAGPGGLRRDGPPRARSDRRPRGALRLRRRADRGRQENSFPWIERDCGVEFDPLGMPVVDPRRSSRPARTCTSAATRRSDRRTSSGRFAHGHEAAVSIDKFLNGEDVTERRRPGVTLASQKMASTSGATTTRSPPTPGTRCWRDVNQCFTTSGSRSRSASTPRRPGKRRSAA